MNNTILIIDSYPEMREILGKTLALSGYRTLEAETISQGRTLFKDERPDLIILDVYLPDGSGLRFCEELRKTDSVPFLFSSGRAIKEDGSYLTNEMDRLECYQAGASGFLSKPYDLNELLAEVKVLLH